jgi:outer membrane protein TolC
MYRSENKASYEMDRIRKVLEDKITAPRVRPSRVHVLIIGLYLVLCFQTGCKSPSEYRSKADKVAADIIQEKQKQALGHTENFGIERPSDILRRRLLADQNLPYSGNASLGTDKLQPIKHWPESGYPGAVSSADVNDMNIPVEPNKPAKLSLIDALQVGALNSPEYQSQKESVFQKALALDLERNSFRTIFRSQQGQNPTVQSNLSVDASGDSTVSKLDTSGTVSLTRKLESGAQLTTALAIDLASLLTQSGASALGVSLDTSVSIPLLRGAGEYIVTEPLTQAERDVVYQIWNFERFKRTFAVGIAGDYFSVLQQMDQVTNAQENYRSAIASARWSRRRADAGRLSEIQVDQAVQSELRARNTWISAQQQLKSRLDSFKSSIGLPPDARIELDPNDLEQLRARAAKLVEEITQASQVGTSETVPPADAPVELVPAGYEGAGPLEMDESVAVKLALKNRLDLRAALGGVYDAQRQVVVKADALRAGLTLGGTASFGGSPASGSADDVGVNFDKGRYTALLSLDLPIERTAERNDYRNSLIKLEQATRTVQTLEDQIKLSIRNTLRTLLQSRESLKIQARSVVVAQKQVKSSNLFLEAGRIQIRDLLEAQDSLLSAQNSLTSAVVNYRIAELELQRDLDVLKVNEKGLWREFSPEEIENVEQRK